MGGGGEEELIGVGPNAGVPTKQDWQAIPIQASNTCTNYVAVVGYVTSSSEVRLAVWVSPTPPYISIALDAALRCAFYARLTGVGHGCSRILCLTSPSDMVKLCSKDWGVNVSRLVSSPRHCRRRECACAQTFPVDAVSHLAAALTAFCLL